MKFEISRKDGVTVVNGKVIRSVNTLFHMVFSELYPEQYKIGVLQYKIVPFISRGEYVYLDKLIVFKFKNDIAGYDGNGLAAELVALEEAVHRGISIAKGEHFVRIGATGHKPKRYAVLYGWSGKYYDQSPDGGVIAGCSSVRGFCDNYNIQMKVIDKWEGRETFSFDGTSTFSTGRPVTYIYERYVHTSIAQLNKVELAMFESVIREHIDGLLAKRSKNDFTQRSVVV